MNRMAAKSTALTACIITFNEADRIGACIEALRFCDEIVVVDSRSSDDTRALAARLGADEFVVLAPVIGGDIESVSLRSVGAFSDIS